MYIPIEFFWTSCCLWDSGKGDGSTKGNNKSSFFSSHFEKSRPSSGLNDDEDDEEEEVAVVVAVQKFDENDDARFMETRGDLFSETLANGFLLCEPVLRAKLDRGEVVVVKQFILEEGAEKVLLVKDEVADC